MTKDDSQKIYKAAAERSLDPRLQEHYSGRYMYGRRTHAVVIDGSAHDVRDLCAVTGVEGTRIDSLGLGVVIY